MRARTQEHLRRALEYQQRLPGIAETTDLHSGAYGGAGTPTLETRDNWVIPGHAALALAPYTARGCVAQA